MKSDKGLTFPDERQDHTGCAMVLRTLVGVAVSAIVIVSMGCIGTTAKSRSYVQARKMRHLVQIYDMNELQMEVKERDTRIGPLETRIDEIYANAANEAKRRGIEGYAFTVTQSKELRQIRENIDVLKAERKVFSDEIASRTGGTSSDDNGNGGNGGGY